MSASAERSGAPEPDPAGSASPLRAVPTPPDQAPDRSGSGSVRIGLHKPMTIREREAEARRRKMRARSVAADFHAQRLRQDRWGWRRRIRRDPRKLAFYRAIIGVLGTMFICLGIITGPLPGPGGIPLVLLGLAIWASEFHWAHKIMVWFRARIKQYQSWTLRQRVTFWLVFSACCGTLIYTYLLVIGPPGWMPDFVLRIVTLLPGV